MPDFDSNYPQNPFVDITTKTRPVYLPDLLSVYRREAIYNRFVGVKFNMNGMGATEMYVDAPVALHPNHDPAGVRDIWGDAVYQDFYKRKITFNRYKGKLSYHEYDSMITYWKQDGVRGLARIIQNGLGEHITGVMDKLARDAFMSMPYATYGTATGSKFNTIQAADVLSTAKIEDIVLGMKERDVPVMATGDGSPGATVCITTPGALRDLRHELMSSTNGNTWTDVHKYQNSVKLIKGEVGMYHGVRFVETNNACLYNAGDITVQTTVTAPINAGDGAPDPGTTTVDSVEYVGQPDATHSITVASTTTFAVGDLVTLHQDRTANYGITNGLDFKDGKAQLMRIVSIPDSTHLVFSRPVMEGFTTDLGSGVYAYVTKGRHVHTATFIAAPDGVVMGVLRPVNIKAPRPVDDHESIYRVTWDAYVGYQVFNPNAGEVAFLAGSNRYIGDRYI